MSGFLDNLPSLSPDGEDRPPRQRRPPYPDGALYVRTRCPACNSVRCPVYDSNHIPIRYHRCQGCGKTFKSVEAGYRPDDGK
jgi:ribosomal protein S27E